MVEKTIFGTIMLLLLASLTLVLWIPKSQAEPEIYSDDFSTDTGMWEYLGSAYRDSANQYLVITEPVGNQRGVAFFNITFKACFTANFSYKAGGGSGADGFVMFFYKRKYSSFHYGGTLAFNDLYPNGTYKIIPGYGIEFDNWRNIERPGLVEHADPSGNHIALIKDHAGNHLSYVNDPRTEDNLWHNVSITVKESSIEVIVDEVSVFQWNGIIDRTFGSFGFCGATGSANNWHIIDNFSIKFYSPSTSRIKAALDFDPNILNLICRSRWITAYIELPEGYDVADIDVSTIMLNGTVPVDLCAPIVIGDYDNDSVPDLMVGFNGTLVSSYILSSGVVFGNVTLTLTGQLYSGTFFEGSDIILVSALAGDINVDGKVDMRDLSIIALAFGSYPGDSRWNPEADINGDNKINMKDLVIICKNFGETYG